MEKIKRKKKGVILLSIIGLLSLLIINLTSATTEIGYWDVNFSGNFVKIEGDIMTGSLISKNITALGESLNQGGSFKSCAGVNCGNIHFDNTQKNMVFDQHLVTNDPTKSVGTLTNRWYQGWFSSIVVASYALFNNISIVGDKGLIQENPISWCAVQYKISIGGLICSVYTDIVNMKVSIRDATGSQVINQTLTGDLEFKGNLFGNLIYAEMNATHSGDVQIVTQGVYANVTNMSIGHNNGFSLLADHTLIVNYGGVYEISTFYSFSGSANQEYHSRLAVNGIGADGGCHAERVIGTGGDVGDASFGCLQTLYIGDFLNIQFENINSTNNPSIHDINFNIKRMGNL